MRLILAFLMILAGAPALAAPPPAPLPRVRMLTSEGAIVIELEAKRAPITSANFLAYVARKRFDGRTFYRTARSRVDPKRGFIQGGIRRNYQLMLTPIPIERTDKTGLTHDTGAISMAHSQNPNTAMGDFFISVGPNKAMDARGAYAGYAAFGHVVAGMDVVRRILAAPIIPGAGGEEFRDQWIAKPIQIISARRVR